MDIGTINSRVFRAAKRSLLIALTALVVTGAVLPPSVSAAPHTIHLNIPEDGSGDNPVMP